MSAPLSRQNARAPPRRRTPTRGDGGGGAFEESARIYCLLLPGKAGPRRREGKRKSESKFLRLPTAQARSPDARLLPSRCATRRARALIGFSPRGYVTGVRAPRPLLPPLLLWLLLLSGRFERARFRHLPSQARSLPFSSSGSRERRRQASSGRDAPRR